MDDFYIKESFFSKTVSLGLFNRLKSEIKWSEFLTKESGEILKLKRKMAYCSDIEKEYKYANLILNGYKWTKSLLYIKCNIERCTLYNFNSVILNMYNDGKDKINWHSDNEVQLGPNPVIACLSLGATRTFKMLEKQTGKRLDIPLNNGDLLIMKENCQRNWLHAILPENEINEPRISLTFRWNFENDY